MVNLGNASFPRFKIIISKNANIGNICIGLLNYCLEQKIDLKFSKKRFIIELLKPYFENKTKTKIFWKLLIETTILMENYSEKKRDKIIKNKLGIKYLKNYKNALNKYERLWTKDKEIYKITKKLILKNIDFNKIINIIPKYTKIKWRKKEIQIFLVKHIPELFYQESEFGYTIPKTKKIIVSIKSQKIFNKKRINNIIHILIHELIHANTEKSCEVELFKKNKLLYNIEDKLLPDFITNEILKNVKKEYILWEDDIFNEFADILISDGYLVDVPKIKIEVWNWYKEYISSNKKYNEGLRELIKMIEKNKSYQYYDFIEKEVNKIERRRS